MWRRWVSHGGISNHSWTNPPREDFEDPTPKKTAGWRPPIAFANLKRNLSIYVFIYIYIYFSTINATVELTTFTSSDNKLEHHLVVRLIIVMSPWNSIKKIGLIPLFLLVYSTFLLNIPNRSHDFQIFMAFAMDFPVIDWLDWLASASEPAFSSSSTSAPEIQPPSVVWRCWAQAYTTICKMHVLYHI